MPPAVMEKPLTVSVLPVLPASENLVDAPVKHWLFREGCAPGPGRPKGAKNWVNRLDSSIATVERKAKKKVLDHFVERALVEDSVLNKLVDKVLPNAGADIASVGGLSIGRAIVFIGDASLLPRAVQSMIAESATPALMNQQTASASAA